MPKPVYFDGAYIRLACGHLTFKKADIDRLLKEGFEAELKCQERKGEGEMETGVLPKR